MFFFVAHVCFVRLILHACFKLWVSPVTTLFVVKNNKSTGEGGPSERNHCSDNQTRNRLTKENNRI